ncbi:MAG: 50S ribosomal protein L7 [Oscillospiraceae bacterium]|nr:50S ribosomal protein L7 [Oscillospiraceae bacterium]
MDKCLHLLGLARKAGALEIGEECVSAGVERVRVRCILSASDASEGSVKRAAFMAREASVPHLVLPYGKMELSQAVGRGSPGMLAFTDTGLAAAFTSELAKTDPGFAPAAERMALKRKRAEERKSSRKAAGCHGKRTNGKERE